MEVDAVLARLLLKEEITEFLHREADLLDERRYEEWLDLLAEDLTYVMPLRLNVRHDEQGRSETTPGEEVCWFDEDKSTLAKRVAQIRTGVHWAEEPLSRVSHLVTNIRILPSDGVGSDEEVVVGSRFLVYRNRVAAETDFFVGRRTDTLRRAAEGGWLIARRHLLLDQNVLLAKNLTLLF